MQLLVDRLRVRQSDRPGVAVMLVLGLLRHRERAGDSGFDLAVGDGAQERDVARLHRPRPPDLADHAGHQNVLPAAPDGLSGMFEVEAVQRGREVV